MKTFSEDQAPRTFVIPAAPGTRLALLTSDEPSVLFSEPIIGFAYVLEKALQGRPGNLVFISPTVLTADGSVDEVNYPFAIVFPDGHWTIQDYEDGTGGLAGAEAALRAHAAEKAKAPK